MGLTRFYLSLRFYEQIKLHLLTNLTESAVSYTG